MKLLIKGMRDTTHSVALVNQFNLLALGKIPGVDLSHHDYPHNFTKVNPGWSSLSENFIKGVSSSNPGEIYDFIFNMEPLCKEEFKSENKFNFFVAEFGTLKNEGLQYLKNTFDNNIDLIVPSNWVKHVVERNLHKAGVIHVIPHGVDIDYFYPIDPSNKKNIKSNLKFSNDDFIFLNLGAMTWNKGIDKLLYAFNIINKKYPHSKLILKDSANLYGIKATDAVNDLISKGLIGSEIVNSITVISQNLNFEQLNNLYNVANCYLAPYRAEGFNIPVLESMFCNTPVIISKGGSTDDFANTSLCTKVDTSFIESEIGFHLEPDIDSLISAMEGAISKGGIISSNEKIEHEIYTKNFTTDLIANTYLMKFIEKKNRSQHGKHS